MWRYGRQGRLFSARAALGVTADRHGKMPDAVLYFGGRGRLLLVKSVTSHGFVDSTCHNELAAQYSKPGLVYVTLFPDRGHYEEGPDYSWMGSRFAGRFSHRQLV